MQSVFATRRSATRADRHMLRGSYTTGVVRADAHTPPMSVFFFLTGEAYNASRATADEVDALLARSTMNFSTTWLDENGVCFPVAVDAHTHPRSVELRRASPGQAHNCVIVTIPDSAAAVEWGLPAGMDVQLGHAAVCTRVLAPGEELLLPSEGSTAADLQCDGLEHDMSDDEVDVDEGCDSVTESEGEGEGDEGDEGDEGMAEAEEELLAVLQQELAEEQEQDRIREEASAAMGEALASQAPRTAEEAALLLAETSARYMLLPVSEGFRPPSACADVEVMSPCPSLGSPSSFNGVFRSP
jgi:hypothetical protein